MFVSIYLLKAQVGVCIEARIYRSDTWYSWELILAKAENLQDGYIQEKWNRVAKENRDSPWHMSWKESRKPGQSRLEIKLSQGQKVITKLKSLTGARACESWKDKGGRGQRVTQELWSWKANYRVLFAGKERVTGALEVKTLSVLEGHLKPWQDLG